MVCMVNYIVSEYDEQIKRIDIYTVKNVSKVKVGHFTYFHFWMPSNEHTIALVNGTHI